MYSVAVQAPVMWGLPWGGPVEVEGGRPPLSLCASQPQEHFAWISGQARNLNINLQTLYPVARLSVSTGNVQYVFTVRIYV